jgi:type IV pilus biogenesis protein CpaD/CtpE
MLRKAVVLSAVLLACGCQDKTAVIQAEREPMLNAWMVRTWHDASIRQAVIEQHTIYPHEFMDASPLLNELGERTVRILADQYRERPGPVVIRQGAAGDDLYQARVQQVRTALASAGVNMERVQVTGGLPGGEGTPSERVRYILETKSDQPLTQQSEDLTLGAGVDATPQVVK